jgi:hypothetical protein
LISPGTQPLSTRFRKYSDVFRARDNRSLTLRSRLCVRRSQNRAATVRERLVVIHYSNSEHEDLVGRGESGDLTGLTIKKARSTSQTSRKSTAATVRRRRPKGNYTTGNRKRSVAGSGEGGACGKERHRPASHLDRDLGTERTAGLSSRLGGGGGRGECISVAAVPRAAGNGAGNPRRGRSGLKQPRKRSSWRTSQITHTFRYRYGLLLVASIGREESPCAQAQKDRCDEYAFVCLPDDNLNRPRGQR